MVNAIKQFILDFFNRFVDILTAPSTHTEMIWIVIPLLIIIILMTLYFSKYKDEELGWNTALGNSLILIFVSVDLFRNVFNSTAPGNIQNLLTNGGATMLISILLLEGLGLMFVNFTHILPKKVAYILSSSLAVNLTAYVLITIVYSKVPVNIPTILAGIAFFILLLLVFTGIGFTARRWWERLEHLKEKEKVEDVKKEKKSLEKTKKVVKEKEKKIEKAVKKEKVEVKKKKEQLKKIKDVVKKREKR